MIVQKIDFVFISYKIKKQQLFKMVKNTTGGTGTKGLARKHQSSHSETLRLPECDLEKFACVTKMLGNGMCEIYTNDNLRLIGHIRNAFRGKNKRHNLITTQSIVLVGLHEWEKIPKNCNIMVIYNQNQLEQLKNNPAINIDHVLHLQLSATTFQTTKKVHRDFDFVEDEPIEIAPQQLPKNDIDFAIEKIDEIDVDDI
jgi:initiation factor 1A